MSSFAKKISFTVQNTNFFPEIFARFKHFQCFMINNIFRKSQIFQNLFLTTENVVGFNSYSRRHNQRNSIKRQMTWHDCLPSLLGDGEKWSEIVYGEEKMFDSGRTRAAKGKQIKSLVPAWRAQQSNQRRNPFICTTCSVPVGLFFFIEKELCKQLRMKRKRKGER